MKLKILFFLIPTIVIYILSFSIFFTNDSEKIVFLTKEDGLFEWAGAIFFFLTGLTFLIAYSIQTSPNEYLFKQKRNIFYFLFGLLFLFGFLEEISWGQRIFNIASPDFFKYYNCQEEINIHNLIPFHRLNICELKTGWEVMLNFDRLFSIFWFSYCILLPLLTLFKCCFTTFIESLKIPIPPLTFGILFLINYLLSNLMINHTGIPAQPVIEIKEFFYAFLFFSISIWFLSGKDEAIYIKTKFSIQKETIQFFYKSLF